LVEGAQPEEKLSNAETWPEVYGQPAPLAELEEDGTIVSDYDPTVIPRESTAHPDNMVPGVLGLSSEGPFVAPAPAHPPESTATAKARKQTVASMSREAAFGTFRDKLFELCFKYGFTLRTTAFDGVVVPDTIVVEDISSAKGTAKRALAVGNHISGLELKS
jgi:hypothetical protein